MPGRSYSREYVRPRTRRRDAGLQAELNRLRDLERITPKAEVRRFETRYTKNADEKVLSGYNYGPFETDQSVLSTVPGRPGTYRKIRQYKWWYRSKIRGNPAPNPYILWVPETIKASGAPNYSPAMADAPNSWIGYYTNLGIPNIDNQAKNMALTRFVGEVRDKNAASLAVTVAEWRRSHEMIVMRASQLSKALIAAKRLRFGDLAKALNVPKTLRPKVTREGMKTSASLWLEYHFGWEPLVKDIYEAVKVLSSNPPPIKVRATGKCSLEVQPASGLGPLWTYHARALVQAEVWVSNVNLALANQLGIINPATVAWELVPFSFLVDWFIPVGKLLDSWSFMLGYGVKYPFNTITRRGTSTDIGTNYDLRFRSFAVNRALGLPPYRLVVPPFKGFSVARGATAISLVIQQFLSLENKAEWKSRFR